MKHELMRPELDGLNFIKFNYWDGGRKGLLSGEALHLDLKRMEMAYHDHNKREYELTKHVSLRQLDPIALLTLKATGACEVTFPEWLFDLDCPGYYMRRIKNVSLSIPAVTGPYTSINCTLSLLRSYLRRSSLLSDGGYGRGAAKIADSWIILAPFSKVTVKKEYFPYFVPGKDIDISQVELHAIWDNQLLPATSDGVDADDLTDALKDDQEFEISLAPDDTVLIRENEALVFLLFRYSIS